MNDFKQTPVVVFNGEYALDLMNDNRGLPLAVGIKNHIVCLIDNEDKGMAIYRCDHNDGEEEQYSLVGLLWWYAGSGRFMIVVRNKSKTVDYQEFVGWLRENHPEDLPFILFHPEIAQHGKFYE